MNTMDALQISAQPSNRKVADFLVLVRPRIALMVLITVMLGGLVASESLIPSISLWHTVIATGLVTASASILNQYLERESDSRMPRTSSRPFVTGAVALNEGLVLGVFCGIAGLAEMLFFVPSPVTSAITAFTFVSYVFIYTPLKSRTTLNTIVGAVPGALPPVIGWSAVTGKIDPGAIALFLIVFVWQIPHFLAIAWKYRDQYETAQLKMLPVGDRTGDRTAQQMLLYGLALVPVSLVPVQIGLAGPLYAVSAGIFAALFLWPIARFQRERSNRVARRVLLASLVYLPGVLAALLFSKHWI